MSRRLARGGGKRHQNKTIHFNRIREILTSNSSYLYFIEKLCSPKPSRTKIENRDPFTCSEIRPQF